MASKNIHPDRIVAALDIGSTKTCAALAVLGEEGAEIAAYSVNPTKGIRKGLIIDLEGVCNSVRTSIDMLEEQVSAKISSVVVGFSGAHAKIIETSGLYHIKKGDISETDISKAVESALSISIGYSFERLHVIPQEFVIDGIAGIKNPLGMTGSRLEAKVAVIAGDSKMIHSIIKSCGQADVDVDCIVLQSLASAEAVLSEEDKEKGIALIDIGGGKTEVSVFAEGALRKIAFIPVGGNHFTNDLIVGLRLPYNEAERIKRIETLNIGFSTELEVFGMDGQIKKIELSSIESILNPRMEELFSLIKGETGISVDNVPLLGAVITGGGARVGGLNHVAESILGLPVRTGLVRIREGYTLNRLNDSAMAELLQPEYAVLIGLLLYGVDKSVAEGKVYRYGAISRLVRGIKRLFPWQRR